MANQVIVVRDVTINYPKLVKLHTPFGTLQWDVQIVAKDEATKAQLESAGVTMKTGENKTWYANIKRKAVNSKGEDNLPPKVINSEKETMSDEKIMSMGNGTQGHVKLYSYDWAVGGKSGTSAMLVAIQVTDYIEYEGAGEDF
jgi:hypothetical protein